MQSDAGPLYQELAMRVSVFPHRRQDLGICQKLKSEEWEHQLP